MLTTALLTLTLAPIATTDVIVKDVHTHAAFAGKLGQTITEDLIVTVQGKEMKLFIDGFYHTKFGAPKLQFREGQTLHLPRGDKNGEFHAFRWEISEVN